MTKDDIIALPNPHLREKSARVHVITNETLSLVNDMTAAALDWEDSRPHEISAALAAVQVDRLERVVIVRSDLDNKSVQDFTALINPEIVNVNGGAIALGHPLGCTGTKLTVQLLDEMKRRNSKYGVVTMCVGTGQGAASVFELL